MRRVWTPRRTLQLSLTIVAFLLFSITWTEAAGLAVLVLCLELFILPQAGVDLRRGEEAGQIERSVLLCPIALLALVLIFRRHLDVVAAAWALFTVGDVMAGAAGEAWGIHTLAFNPRKSWEGFAAFVVFGGAAALLLLLWVQSSRLNLKTFLICAAAGVAGAFVESLPIGLDDNITVPIICGCFIFCAGLITRASFDFNLPYLGVRIILAVAVSLAFALAAWGLRQVTLSGAIAGFLLCVAVYLGYGYKSFLILLSFFVLGTAATRLGYEQKRQRGIAERRRGARGWREAVGNILAPAFFSILVITTPYQGAFLMALVAALAEAAGDTVASETGKWVSSQARLITTFKPVPAGAEGGISLAGTVSGFAASALVVVLGYGLGMYAGWKILAVLLAAFAGNLADSFIGATLERRGLLTNSIVNFIGTGLAGALALAAGLYR